MKFLPLILLLTGCVRQTGVRHPAGLPDLPAGSQQHVTPLLVPAQALVILPTQTFTVSWKPGNANGNPPDYECVLWSPDLQPGISTWRVIATSSPPVRVTVPFVLAGNFAIKDVYTNL